MCFSHYYKNNCGALTCTWQGLGAITNDQGLRERSCLWPWPLRSHAAWGIFSLFRKPTYCLWKRCDLLNDRNRSYFDVVRGHPTVWWKKQKKVTQIFNNYFWGMVSTNRNTQCHIKQALLKTNCFIHPSCTYWLLKSVVLGLRWVWSSLTELIF